MEESVKKRAGRRKIKKKTRKINVALSSMPHNGPSSSNSKLMDAPAPTSVSTRFYNTVPPSTSTGGVGKKKRKGKKNKEREESSPGFIFMCNGRTKPECYRCRVFGLPKSSLKMVKNIKLGMNLFLFDVESKFLYGVYKATSEGGEDLEPFAFNRKFPAQVKFNVFKECLPLHETNFKHAIKDNYKGHKFSQELSCEQVRSLISMFRPITAPLPTSASIPNATIHVRSFPPSYLERPRLPPTQSYYLSSEHHHHAFPVLDSKPQLAICWQNGNQTSAANLPPSVETQHVAQQYALPHHTERYYVAEAHKPYLPEQPFFSPQDTYSRYGDPPAQIFPTEEDRSGNEFYTSQAIPSSDYVVTYYNAQNDPYPSTTSHVISQQAPAYVAAAQPQAHGDFSSSSYQTYYGTAPNPVADPNQVYVSLPHGPVPGSPDLVGPNNPVSSCYQFSGAAYNYC